MAAVNGWYISTMRIVNTLLVSLASGAALACGLGAAAQHLGRASDIPFDGPVDDLLSAGASRAQPEEWQQAS